MQGRELQAPFEGQHHVVSSRIDIFEEASRFENFSELRHIRRCIGSDVLKVG